MKIFQMTADQLAKTKMEVDALNKASSHGKPVPKGGMDKDAFLKLLITELRYQDPTRPMEDREFIAQMAQFSTLEQMTNMNKEIAAMTRSTRSAEGFALLGRHVDALHAETGKRVSGVVTSIQFKDTQQVLLVGNEEITLDDIHAVHDAPASAAPQPVTEGGGKEIGAPAIQHSLGEKPRAEIPQVIQ